MNYQQRTNPGSCVQVVYIAGDTLRHQPMGAGHMTAPVTWAYGIPYPALVIYIAGDTLHHQPMGAGHMTVLQLHGLMGFRVLQWCYPMLASTMRASCCTRITTLYGTQKWIQARTQWLNICGYRCLLLGAGCCCRALGCSLLGGCRSKRRLHCRNSRCLLWLYSFRG